MNIRMFTSPKERRLALEKKFNITLTNIGSFTLDEGKASTRHCENMIGVAQIPLGVAGPLLIQRENRAKEYYIPLATTEGALIASINRGCRAITEAGGVQTVVERVGTSRGPVFQTSSLIHSHQFVTWLESQRFKMEKIVKECSSHCTLLSFTTQIVGTLVFVRFSFDTQDAMGMNMATIVTQQIAEWIEHEQSIRCLSVSGNFCVDKKPSWQNTVLGRGYRAWSEVVIPTDSIINILKTTNEQLVSTWQAKCLIGSAVSGSVGFNGHAANVIAALYLATGQDIAHVVEGSQTITTMSQEEHGVRVSVLLPAILVGTVGGGTGLATQQEALQLLGIDGGNEGKHGEELAGIVSSVVLAGELSELCALSSGTLTKAHQHLARGEHI